MQEGIGFLLKQARPGDAILTIGAAASAAASNELMVLLGTEHRRTMRISNPKSSADSRSSTLSFARELLSRN